MTVWPRTTVLRQALGIGVFLILADNVLLHPALLGAPPQATRTTASNTRTGSGIVPSPAFSDKELAALPTSGWLKNGGNLFNQNYSPLTQINRETVGNVKGVWRTHLDGSGLNVQVFRRSAAASSTKE